MGFIARVQEICIKCHKILYEKNEGRTVQKLIGKSNGRKGRRGNKSRKAFFYADNDRLEMIWTVIPAIVLAVLILFGLYTWTDIMTIEEKDDTLVVELYAQQFNWKARYAGEDGVFRHEGLETALFSSFAPEAIEAVTVNSDELISDIHAPSDYRAHLVKEMTRRAVAACS